MSATVGLNGSRFAAARKNNINPTGKLIGSTTDIIGERKRWFSAFCRCDACSNERYARRLQTRAIRTATYACFIDMPLIKSALNMPQRRRESIRQSLDAANDGTATVQLLYSAFLILLVVGFAIIYGTTHRQLFLDELVSVTIGQSLHLPVSAFYALFPVIFVFLHFQLLWQMHFSATKLQRLNAVAERFGESASNPSIRLRIKNIVLSHTYVDNSVASQVASALIFATVTLLPWALLLFAQLRFLPFHSDAVTIIHRLVISIDVLLVLTMWPTISGMKSSASGTGRRRARSLWRALGFWCAVVAGVIAVLFSFVVATWPGEAWERGVVRSLDAFRVGVTVHPVALNGQDKPVTLWAIGLEPCSFNDGGYSTWSARPNLVREDNRCDVGYGTTIPTALFFSTSSVFARSLRLSGEILTGDQISSVEIAALRALPSERGTTQTDAQSTLEKALLRRFDHRNFAFADFQRTRLARADLSKANIDAANFSGADMPGARVAFFQSRDLPNVPSFRDANLASSNFTLIAEQPVVVHLSAPHASISLSLVKHDPRYKASSLKINAPHSTVSIKLDTLKVPQRPLSSNPWENSLYAGADITGDLSFATVNLRGEDITIEGNYLGAKLTGSLTKLSLADGARNLDGSCSTLTDLSWSEIDFNAGEVDFDCTSLDFASLKMTAFATGGGNAHGDFIVVWPTRDKGDKAALIRWAIPVKFRNGSYLRREDVKTNFTGATRADGYQLRFLNYDNAPASRSWCTVSDSVTRCRREALATESIKQLSKKVCRSLLNDAPLLHAIESGRAMDVLRFWSEQMVAHSKADFYLYVDELVACIELNQGPQHTRAKLIVGKLVWRGN